MQRGRERFAVDGRFSGRPGRPTSIQLSSSCFPLESSDQVEVVETETTKFRVQPSLPASVILRSVSNRSTYKSWSGTEQDCFQMDCLER